LDIFLLLVLLGVSCYNALLYSLRQMLELELFSNHSIEMQILQFAAISSSSQM
jgi:hypothetical protein